MTQYTKEFTVTPAAQKKGFRIHLFVFLVANPTIWLVWYLSGVEYPWPLWQTPAWAVGLLFHYLGVFVFGKNSSDRSALRS